MENPTGNTAAFKVLTDRALLTRVFNFINQIELLTLQRVCSNWKETVSDSVPSMPQLAPTLNTAVFEKILWNPALEVEAANSDQFEAIRESTDHTQKAMGYENASWRKMPVCSPPVTDLLIYNGIIEEDVPHLRLVKGSPDRDDEKDDSVEIKVMGYQDFPHNEGQEVGGITFQDLLYGLRAHYLEFNDILESYYGDVDLDEETAGIWKPELIVKDYGVVELDTGIMI